MKVAPKRSAEKRAWPAAYYGAARSAPVISNGRRAFASGK